MQNIASHLEHAISAKLGELMIENAKLALTVEVLKAEIVKRDAELDKLRPAGEASQEQADTPSAAHGKRANGHVEAAH